MSYQLWIEKEDGCWEWQGARMQNGYGVCNPQHFGHPELGSPTNKGTTLRALAHRVSYAQNVGPIPDGLIVRHTCDNPPCIRPEHLLLGTKAENTRDMVERGRSQLGRVYKTICPRGHYMFGDNLYIKPSGARACRECRRIQNREYEKSRPPRKR